MSKKAKRIGVGIATGGLSETVRAGKKLVEGDVTGALTGATGVGLVTDTLTKKPSAPGLPPAPNTTTDLDIAEKDEEAKRKRRANIATRPLGVLVQQALLSRTLTGQ